MKKNAPAVAGLHGCADLQIRDIFLEVHHLKSQFSCVAIVMSHPWRVSLFRLMLTLPAEVL